MGALSAARDTRKKGAEQGFMHSLKMTDNKKIYPGALCVVTSGYCKPGVTETAGIAVGRAKALADNTVTGHTTGGISAEVEEGTFCWDNSATDPVVQADVGNLCYIEDDHTVSHTDTNQSVAGVVVGIEPDGQIAVAMGMGQRQA